MLGRTAIGLVLALLVALPATAQDLTGLVGWCIIDTKTISGRIDGDGKRSDDFEGCDFGRKILFLDGTYLTCSSYS